jgi:exonuclease III
MFHHFVRSNAIDILFLQEVISEEVLHMPGYEIYCNLGTEMRGTTFLVREGIRMDHVEKLSSGRAIAEVFQGILLVNLYAPTGTSRKTEREAFYNLDFPSLLRNEVSHGILGWDFNCVMQPCDVTGHYTRCKALEEIINGYSFKDS